MTNEKEVTIDNFDDSDFEEISLGYHPYWTPEMKCTECGMTMADKEFVCRMHPEADLIGNRFYGTLLEFQPPEVQVKGGQQDQNMVDRGKFVFQAMVDMQARTGKKIDGEVVHVKKGDFFVVNAYAGLKLQGLFGLSMLIQPKCQRMVVSKTQNGKSVPFWDFSVKLDSKTKQLIDSQRHELGRLAAQAHRERQLAAIGQMGVKPPAQLENGAAAPAAG